MDTHAVYGTSYLYIKNHEIIVPNRFNFSLIFLQNSCLIWFTIYITRVLYSYTFYHTFSCHGPIIHEANTHYQPKPCNVSVLIWHCYESLFGSSNHRNQCWFNKFSLVKEAPDTKYQNIYTIVWFFRALRWYIGPPAIRSGAIGCDSRPAHCRRDDIPAWRPNKITLLSLLPLDLTMS